VATGLIGRHNVQNLLAAAALVGCFALTHFTHAAGVHERVSATATHPRDHRGGVTLILQDRYLLLIALTVFILNLINTTGDFLLAQLVNRRAEAIALGAVDGARARQQFIGAFYWDFQTWVSALTALAQIVVVARVFKKMGIARALFLLPAFAITGYGASALMPGLALMAAVIAWWLINSGNTAPSTPLARSSGAGYSR